MGDGSPRGVEASPGPPAALTIFRSDSNTDSITDSITDRKPIECR